MLLCGFTTQLSSSSSRQTPARSPVLRHRSSVVAAAAKKQKPKKRKPKQPVSQRISYIEEDYLDDNGYDDGDDQAPQTAAAAIRLVPGARVPKAPAPKAAPAGAALEPEEVYPVFPRQPKAVERLPGSKWSWDGAGGDSQNTLQQQQPQDASRLWNPRTGFMRTRAELEQQQQGSEQPSTASSSSSSSSSAAAPVDVAPQPSQAAASSSTSSSSGAVERLPQGVRNPLQPPQLPPSAAKQAAALASAASPAAPPSSSAGDDGAQQEQQQLPSVGRGQVLTSCALTAAAMTGAAVGLSLLAAKQSSALLGTNQADIDRLLQLPVGLQDVQQVGVMLAAAGVVTAARFVLKQQWPEFREATDRSNQQVLSSLGWPDVVLVALLSGGSEELLFRWGLISATWPDARGVLLSGAVFGVLHVSGGRNAAFAAWATAVGWLYGAAFLATGNVWVPAGAHALANFASAAAWVTGNDTDKQQQQ